MDQIQSWYNINEKEYYISNKTVLSIPAGLYAVIYSESHGTGLYKYQLDTDEYIELPSIPNDEMLKNIDQFIDAQHKFREYNILSQKNILLSGGHGCGLTTTINHIVKHAIKRECVAIYFDNPDTWCYLMRSIKNVEPNRTIICIIDTLDFMIHKNTAENLLNFFNELVEFNNVICLATENNIKNNDIISCFDVHYTIPQLSHDDLLHYFEKKLGKEQTKKYKLKESFEEISKNKFDINMIKKIFSHFCIYNESISTVNKVSGGNCGKSVGFK